MAKDETIKTMQEASTPKEANTKLQQISDEIENTFRADENGEAVAKALGQEYDNQINTAIKQSEEIATQIDKSVAEFSAANPNATAADIQRHINKTYASSQNEKELTRIINDDKPVTPRMAGYRVLTALQKTMDYPTRFERESVVARFKKHGFSDELTNAFADAYITDDISVARKYLDSKVAGDRAKSVEEIKTNSLK